MRFNGGVMGAPNFALLEEVADSTGMASRYADAIGMDLWKSNGYEWHGFEIKASRADWLNELKAPEKSEPFRCHMDRWWLVIGDAAIVKAGELPEGWGLLAPRDGRLVVAHQAPMLSAQPMPRSFMAAIMRRVVEQSVDAERLKEAEERGYANGWRMAEQVANNLKYARQRLREVKDHVDLALRGAPSE